MNKNQIKFIIILFVIALVLFFIFRGIKTREDKINKNKLPNKTEILTPTVDFSNQSRDSFRQAANNDRLKQIKSNLIGGINYEGLIIDYRPKIDTIIIFYEKSREEAVKKTNDFFKKQGIAELKRLKIEYIGLEKNTEEPPSGYFR